MHTAIITELQEMLKMQSELGQDWQEFAEEELGKMAPQIKAHKHPGITELVNAIRASF